MSSVRRNNHTQKGLRMHLTELIENIWRRLFPDSILFSASWKNNVAQSLPFAKELPWWQQQLLTSTTLSEANYAFTMFLLDLGWNFGSLGINCMRLHWPVFAKNDCNSSSSNEQSHARKCIWCCNSNRLLQVMGADSIFYHAEGAFRLSKKIKTIELCYLFGKNGLLKSGIGCALGTCSFLSCLISISSSICTTTPHHIILNSCNTGAHTSMLKKTLQFSCGQHTFSCLSFANLTSSMKLVRSATCRIEDSRCIALRNSSMASEHRSVQLTWWSNLARPTARTSLCSTRSMGSVGSLIGGFTGYCERIKEMKAHKSSLEITNC